MIRKERAAMPDEVREGLEAEIAQAKAKGVGDYWQIPVVLMVMGGFAWVKMQATDNAHLPSMKDDPGMGVASLVLVAGIVAVIAFFYYMHERKTLRPNLNALKAELDAGLVDVLTVDGVQDAVALDEFPPALFLDLGDNRCLFLQGSMLPAARAGEDGRLEWPEGMGDDVLPNTAFVAVLLGSSGRLVQVSCSGQGLRPREMMRRGSFSEGLPVSGTIIPNGLDRLSEQNWVPARRM